MGKRGPAPKPTELKRLAGNPGKRPLNESEPKPTGTPACPSWLGKEAKAEWKRILPALVELNLIGKVDRAALAAYCVSFATFREAEEAIQKHGYIFSTENGYLQQRPEVGIRSKALEQMRQFLSEFGMTPSSRTRLVVPPPKEIELDPMSEFLS